nr:VanZ family protein [Shewanella sp. WXL01]
MIVTFIIVSYLVFSKPGNYPVTFQHMDKVGHLGSFFALSYLAYYAFKPKWYILTSILTLYAILIEVIQSQLPYRNASVDDVAADLLGVGLFYVCLKIYHMFKYGSKGKAGAQSIKSGELNGKSAQVHSKADN